MIFMTFKSWSTSGMDIPKKIGGYGINTTASFCKKVHFIVMARRDICSMVNKQIYENSVI